MMGVYTIKLEEKAIDTCETIIEHILENIFRLVWTFETVTCVLTTVGDMYRYKVGFLNSM